MFNGQNSINAGYHTAVQSLQKEASGVPRPSAQGQRALLNEVGRIQRTSSLKNPRILSRMHRSSSKVAFRAVDSLPSSNISSRVATARLARCASTSTPPAPRRTCFPNPLALSRIPLQPSTTNTRIEERALHHFRHPMPPDLCPLRKQSRISPIRRHHRALNHIKSRSDDNSYTRHAHILA